MLTGSPYARFRRALKTRNLQIIRAAAAELPRVELRDALEVCLIVRDRQPERFEAAAVRLIARYCREQPNLTLELVDAAVAAFRELQRDPKPDSSGCSSKSAPERRPQGAIGGRARDGAAGRRAVKPRPLTRRPERVGP